MLDGRLNMSTEQEMINRAKQFYDTECNQDASKRKGDLYIHNLIDKFNQKWSAKFQDGRFVSIKKVKR
jgi:hypothetical protein